MPDIVPNQNNSESRYEVITMAEDLAQAKGRPAAPSIPSVNVSSSSSVEAVVSKSAAPSNLPIAGSVEPEVPRPKEPESISVPRPMPTLSAKTNVDIISEVIKEAEPQQIKADDFLKKIKFRKWLKLAISIALAFAIVGTAGFFIYSKFFGNGVEPTPITSETPIFTPKSILNLNIQENISLLNNTTDELNNILSALVNQEFLGMKELVIKSQTLGDVKLDLINVMEILNIGYPRELFAIFDSNYYEIFIHNFGKKGNLGFVIEVSLDDVMATKEIMENWENSMIESFKPFYFGRYNSPDSFNFKDAFYNGVNIRYINLNTPELSIDYAILNAGDKNYILFTTSKESMFDAIDKITGGQKFMEEEPGEFIEYGT